MWDTRDGAISSVQPFEPTEWLFLGFEGPKPSVALPGRRWHTPRPGQSCQPGTSPLSFPDEETHGMEVGKPSRRRTLHKGVCAGRSRHREGSPPPRWTCSAETAPGRCGQGWGMCILARVVCNLCTTAMFRNSEPSYLDSSDMPGFLAVAMVQLKQAGAQPTLLC